MPIIPNQNLLWAFIFLSVDADRARKHGMDEFIHKSPCEFDHSALFELLQELTLDHRLNDSYSCLVSSIHFPLQNPIFVVVL